MKKNLIPIQEFQGEKRKPQIQSRVSLTGSHGEHWGLVEESKGQSPAITHGSPFLPACCCYLGVSLN